MTQYETRLVRLIDVRESDKPGIFLYTFENAEGYSRGPFIANTLVVSDVAGVYSLHRRYKLITTIQEFTP